LPTTCNYSGGDNSLLANLPADIKEEKFFNRWHHIALAFRKQQMKVYVDQYRVLVIPHTSLSPVHLELDGIGDQNAPIVFKNMRIASGGNMNMLGKKFTDAKIITHGINFDIDKATLKPESMGTLNMIVSVLKDNPAIKFEIDGHTDNSGSAAHNLVLSQQRAESVKAQLVNMGVDAARLTNRGFGDTKPISNNNTPEGKANNRRVEFVKM
jgi:outer membrane protein OmpA-like peptidoglycan-associated protein